MGGWDFTTEREDRPGLDERRVDVVNGIFPRKALTATSLKVNESLLPHIAIDEARELVEGIVSARLNELVAGDACVVLRERTDTGASTRVVPPICGPARGSTPPALG